jgi:ABC-type Zn uptake system ZnuABC Zn-binding protein ZnuA
VSEADVIFVNGWDLEEGLVDDLAIIAGNTPIVAVGANIEPLYFGSDGEKPAERENQKRGQVDPHTWLAVPNVVQWVENITAILSDLDPDSALIFERNAQAYRLELEEADAYVRQQAERLPVEKRVLVTNHDAFNYFAEEYGFSIVGTIIPALSTLAEPSARDLADLVKVMEVESVCTIFSENTIGDDLAQTVAAELQACEEVFVLPLYSGSIGGAGSGVYGYTEFIRANVDTIVEGLE